MPTVEPVSVPTQHRGPLDDEDEYPFFFPWGGSDDDGVDVGMNEVKRITEMVQKALEPVRVEVESLGPDSDADWSGPDGEGKILGFEGHAYADTGKWSTLNGQVKGEYSLGVDGEGTLSVSETAWTSVAPRSSARGSAGRRSKCRSDRSWSSRPRRCGVAWAGKESSLRRYVRTAHWTRGGRPGCPHWSAAA